MKKELINKSKLERLKKQFVAYANRMLREAKVTVEVVFVKNGSLTYFETKDTAIIQIGIEDAFDIHENLSHYTNSFPVVKTRLEGFLNHEIGHLLYTQFERMGYCKNKEKEAQLAIALIGKDKRDELVKADESVSIYGQYNDDFWKSTVPNVNTYEELKMMFISRVYWHNMATMINMVEDAAIECRVPAKAGLGQASRDHIYGCIASARNHIYSREISNIKHDDDMLKGAMFEFHEFGVIGYRMKTPTPHLNKMFSRKDVEKLYDLAMYSKWNTKNSEERYVTGRVVMDKLMPWIEEKAMEHLSSYMIGLYMSADPAQLPDMGGGASSEVSISMPNQTASGSHNQRSEYDYDIPNETKKEIQKEQEKVENEGQNETSNSSNNDASSESQSEDKTQDQDNNQNKQGGENQNGNQNDDAQNNGSSQQSQSVDTQSTERQSSEEQHSNSKGSSSEKGGKSDEQSVLDDKTPNSEEDGADSSNNDANRNENTSSSSKEYVDTKDFGQNISKPLDKKSLESIARKENELAEQAVKEEEQKTATQEETELKDSIKEQVSNMRKQLNKNQPAECNIDFHKDVRTTIETFFNDSINQNAKNKQREDKKMSIKVSSEINLLKMYDKRAKTKVTRNGKLNNASLYRAMTDQKCFKKVTPGKKKNFRVALLMDLSGSMRGSKITNAIRTAYILANSCIKSNVPVSVWGHNYWHDCHLYKFLDYNQKAPKLLDNIYYAAAEGSNQDGLAIFQVAHDLVAHKHANEELVLIVLSDGAPAGANGYYGLPAENDIKKIVGQYKKLFNVHTIGVTIETCQKEIESCKRIYGDNAVIVKDSSQLALETISLLKNLICN